MSADRILLIENPARISVDHGRLKIARDGEDDAFASPDDIAVLCLHNHTVSITTQALKVLALAGASVLVTDDRHYPCALMLPLAGNMAAPQRLHEQIQLIGKSQVGELWAQIVRSRLATQAANLRHFDLNGALRLERLAGEVKPGDVSNAEAQGAKHYWKHFFFGSEFTREKEGAEDGLNARLNYGFAVLRALVARQLAMSGLNAGLGLGHRRQDNPFNLADGAGTSVARFSIAANGSYVHVHVEDVAAPSASETAIAPTWALAASPTGVPVLLHVACYEIPRTELALDANEYGVDLTSCYAGRPIYTTTGKGIGAVSTAVQQAQTVAQRAGAFHFARDTGEALSTTAAAYTPVFLADSVPVHLGRKLYTTSTVRTLQVRAYCRAGATTVGKLRFTMTSGDSVVLDITSGMAAAWLTGELDVDCEDLSVSDGRRSARDDKCTIDWYRVSGANSVYIESISIGNG